MTAKDSIIQCKRCGETDLDKFYTKKTKYCKSCISHINKIKRRKRALKEDIISFQKAVSNGVECTKCNKYKPLGRMVGDARLKYGVKRVCLECNSGVGRKFYEENTDKCKARYLKWAENNKKTLACIREKYQIENKEKVNKRAMELYYINHDKSKTYARIKVAERNAIKIQAKPVWANDGYINLWYILAREEEKRTGKKVHVDHIVPLRGKNVCGLHHEHNMQLLFAEDNISKGNRWNDGEG